MITQYKFQVIDPTGKEITGIMEGNNPRDVGLKLKEKGYYIVAPIIPAKREITTLITEGKLSSNLLAEFAKKLSTLLRGGVPLVTALELLGTEETRKNIAHIIKLSLVYLYQGKSFYQAINLTKKFPHFFVRIVAIGEISGKLTQSLTILNEFYRDQYQFKQQINKILFYPILVSLSSLSVFLLFLFFILPKLSMFFINKGEELPKITMFLLKITEINYIFTFTILILIFIMTIIAIKWTQIGGKGWVFFKWHLPLVSQTYQLFYHYNLSMGLGFMLSNGISLLEALTVNRKVIQDTNMTNKINQIEKAISLGESLTKAMVIAKLFSPMDRQLIKVGEESGNLGEVFNYLAEQYQEDFKNYLTKLVGYLEPLLIFTLSILVAVIVAGIILPMYQMSNFTF